MANARFDRYVLVWENGMYCSAAKYTAEEFNAEFTEKQRAKLLDGYEVKNCVDLEAYYHRKSMEEAQAEQKRRLALSAVNG